MELKKFENFITTKFDEVFNRLRKLDSKVDKLDKRLENLEDKLTKHQYGTVENLAEATENTNVREIVKIICYWHSKHGQKADNCSGNECYYAQKKSTDQLESNELTATCESILEYMKMPKFVSPIKDFETYKSYTPPRKSEPNKSSLHPIEPVQEKTSWHGPPIELLSVGLMSEEKKEKIKKKSEEIKTKLSTVKKRRKSTIHPYHKP